MAFTATVPSESHCWVWAHNHVYLVATTLWQHPPRDHCDEVALLSAEQLQ